MTKALELAHQRFAAKGITPTKHDLDDLARIIQTTLDQHPIPTRIYHVYHDYTEEDVARVGHGLFRPLKTDGRFIRKDAELRPTVTRHSKAAQSRQRVADGVGNSFYAEQSRIAQGWQLGVLPPSDLRLDHRAGGQLIQANLRKVENEFD